MTEKKKKISSGKTRREFLKDAGLLVGGTAIGSTILLAACGGGETETVTNTVTRTNTATVTSTLPGETQTVTTTVGAGQTATITQTQTDTITQSRFICPECGMEFVTLVELQTHFDTEHQIAGLGIVIVNGKEYRIDCPPNWTLLDFLRDKLFLTGTKESCNKGECGFCTVLADGKAILACMVLALTCNGKQITTIEGLADPNTKRLTRLQQSFMDYFGWQCGFCTPGFIMAAKELLDNNPNPTEQEIKEATAGVLCICGNYSRIIESVKKAA
jgi:aerobic-type carbon monoxide dehydrogenase small subunit (CoxS/CutS family)/DNA-directed RNA polymerase subunit M/transcription elongation factor TFIIS